METHYSVLNHYKLLNFATFACCFARPALDSMQE